MLSRGVILPEVMDMTFRPGKTGLEGETSFRRLQAQ